MTLRDLGQHIVRHDRQALPRAVLSEMVNGTDLIRLKPHWPALLTVLKTLPDAPPSVSAPYRKIDGERIPLTRQMIAQLNGEFERTGVAIVDVERLLLRREMKSRRKTPIVQWKKGMSKTVPRAEWDRVIALLEHLPDKGAAMRGIPGPPPPTPPKTEKKPYRIETPAYPKRQRTLTSMDDSEAAPDLKPDEILPARAREGLSSHQVNRHHKALGYVQISEAQYRKLHAERRRTLVSARRLVASAPDVPGGLRARHIDSWLLGRTLSAEEHYLEWVLEAYARLPTAQSQCLEK